jgi:hypothetical protein
MDIMWWIVAIGVALPLVLALFWPETAWRSTGRRNFCRKSRPNDATSRSDDESLRRDGTSSKRDGTSSKQKNGTSAAGGGTPVAPRP